MDIYEYDPWLPGNRRLMAKGQPYSDGNKPGRVDRRGIMWWACDPYPTWFRWEETLFDDDVLIERPLYKSWWGLDGWADEPVSLKPPPCRPYSCRLYTLVNDCPCLENGDQGAWAGPDYDLHVQLAYQELLRKEREKHGD